LIYQVKRRVISFRGLVEYHRQAIQPIHLHGCALMSTFYAQVKGFMFASHHTWRMWGWLRVCWESNLQQVDVSYPNAWKKAAESFGSKSVDSSLVAFMSTICVLKF